VEADRKTELFEDARIVFKNFKGAEGKYNQEGDRNFCLLLDQDRAERLFAKGWNVKSLRAKEEGDLEQPYLQVSVQHKNKPPKISIVTSKGKTYLEEEMCEILDWVDIARVDLILNPYEWSVNGKSGVKAYLKTLVAIIEEDYLELKYADLEELPARAGRVIEAAPDYIDGEVVDERRAIGR
jgi:hypothetical protein